MHPCCSSHHTDASRTNWTWVRSSGASAAATARCQACVTCHKRNPGLDAGPSANRLLVGGGTSAAGILDQRSKRVIEVRADRRTELPGRRTRRLEAVHDADAVLVKHFDAVHRPKNGPRDFGLIHEPLSTDDIHNSQMDRILAMWSHRDHASGREG